MAIKLRRSEIEKDLLLKISNTGIDPEFASKSIHSIKMGTAKEVSQAVKKFYLPKGMFIVIVLALFITSNIWVFYILMQGFMSDIKILEKLTNPEILLYQRLVSEKVIMALIVATTTQVGTAFILAARYLIKTR